MRFKKYLKEDTELEQTFSDFIEMYIENGDKEKEDKYRKLFKEKFGREYQAYTEFRPKPSLDTIYSKDDFKRYNDYIKYSNDLYTLKFRTYSSKIKNISKPEVTPQQAIDFYTSLGIEMKFGNVRGTEEAHVRNGKVTFKKQYENRNIPKEIIIHELGHVFDESVNNASAYSDLFLHNMKSSVYDLSPVEIFAESFMNYFINPNFLRSGWEGVYDYFNKKIPSKWKSAVKKLINT